MSDAVYTEVTINVDNVPTNTLPDTRFARELLAMKEDELRDCDQALAELWPIVSAQKRFDAIRERRREIVKQLEASGRGQYHAQHECDWDTVEVSYKPDVERVKRSREPYKGLLFPQPDAA